MTFQEIATLLLVGAAAGYLALRWWRRRSTGNCCGEAECPAAKATLDKLERARRLARASRATQLQPSPALTVAPAAQ